MSLEPIIVIHPTADMIEYYSNILNEISRENESNEAIRIVDFEHVRYVFSNFTDEFVRLRQFDEVSTTNQLIHPNGNIVPQHQRDVL